MSQSNPDDEYPRRPDRKPVYLNIIWHQHQPLYVNPETDQLSGPWVRTHATKDYYDMAALLTRYPDIHCSINLTSSLLVQLGEYYVKRLRPFVDIARNSIETEGFLKAWGGKTDPWIDLALKPTSTFTRADRDLLYRNAWNAFGISEVMLERFPEYQRLQKKLLPGRSLPDDLFSEQEQREIKFWFYLASFDPDFLNAPVKLVTGVSIDLTDYLERRGDGTYWLRRKITEDDCNRIAAETYKVLSAILPLHKKMMYNPSTFNGQVEVITTPYYHQSQSGSAARSTSAGSVGPSLSVMPRRSLASELSSGTPST